jgi:hypothetical protein
VRSVAEKIAATERLLSAARTVANDASLFRSLVDSSGLSPENVRRALDEHMETSASQDEIERFVLKFADTSLVTVVLSSNVFIGALRAIACARAKGERVVVRPSSREPAFATALVRAAADPEITLVERVDIRAIAQGEIHVYGRDETIAKVKRAARVPVIGHGHGLGVAWLTLGADPELFASRIANDVVIFDQRGCLSLRVLFVEGGPSRAQEVARLMHRTLNTSAIPRGTLLKEERAESLRFVDTMTMTGEVFEGHSHVVALTGAEAPAVVPPAGRHLVVRPAVNDAELLRPLEKMGRFVCAFGTDDVARARASGVAPRHARLSQLGRMQKPPLDGHVDLRVTS